MSLVVVAQQTNAFLLQAANRDKMARFVFSLIRLLVDYLQRSGKAQTNKEAMAQLQAVAEALKTTRNSFQWLRQIGFAVQLSKMPPLQDLAQYCSAASKVCMIGYVTMKNIEWLISMKLTSGNQAYFSQTAFKFYTFSWMFELLPRVMKAQEKTMKPQDTLLIVRDALLVLEGMANAGWQQVDPRILALIGMFSSGFDCYLSW